MIGYVKPIMIISLADGRLRFYPRDDSPNTPLPISRRLGTSTGCFPSNSLGGMGLMIKSSNLEQFRKINMGNMGLGDGWSNAIRVTRVKGGVFRRKMGGELSVESWAFH